MACLHTVCVCVCVIHADLSPGEIYEGIMRHFNAVMPPSLNTDAAPDATAGDAVGDEDAGPSAGPAAGGAAAGRSTGGTQTGGSHRRKSRPGTRDAGAGQGDDGGAQGAAPKRRKVGVRAGHRPARSNTKQRSIRSYGVVN